MSETQVSPDLFPDPIITNILTRLPAKTLHRFKSVSKRWNSLISHPRFINSYISRAPPTWAIIDRVVRVNSLNSPSFTHNHPPAVSTLSLPTSLSSVSNLSPRNSPVVIAASNGLLLIGARRAEQNVLFVVNPVTGEFTQLPNSRRPINNRNALAFATKVDRVTRLVKDFVVVEYRPRLGTEDAILLFYSSETGEWDEVQGYYLLGKHMWKSDGAFVFHGKLFWTDLSVGLIYLDDDDPFRLFTYGDDVAECEYFELPDQCVPSSSMLGLENRRCVGVGGGRIQYLELSEDGRKYPFCLWRLDSLDCGGWSLVYQSSLTCPWGWGSILHPQFFHPFQVDVVGVVLDDWIFLMDIKSKKKKVETGRPYKNEAGCMFLMSFVIPRWPSPLPLLNAAVAKDHGNEAFTEKKFDVAIHWYSKSILRSPTAVAYTNRAAAYLNIKRYLEAENDCTEALKLDARFIKAYWRRVVARKELGKLKEAVQDAEHTLKLDPSQDEMQKLYLEVKSLLQMVTSDEGDGKGGGV